MGTGELKGRWTKARVGAMSGICRPNSSPRRTPVTPTSHRYSPRGCRGWWSLHLSAGYPQPHPGKSPVPASCRADALARDADRNHPDEVLGFGPYPRLKANGADRRTLGLGIHVMRRATHYHHPPLLRFRIDLVD